MKKCKHCKQPFEPLRPLMMVCSLGCAVAMKKTKDVAKIRKEREREEKVKMGLLKESIQTTTDLGKMLQAIINSIVRAIDYGQPCLSCQKSNDVDYHAGHYWHKSKNSASNCTFNLWNLHKQCGNYCNINLRGNSIHYRKNILKIYGQKYLDLLEEMPEKYQSLSFDKPQLKEAITTATKILKSLPKEKVYTTEQRIELRETINQQLNLYK